MSPIRESERRRYPEDWKAISAEVKERAGNQCECWGECGHPRHSTKYRCPEIQYAQAARFNGKVILTVAHLDHTPENNGTPGKRPNLKAMCQLCHLSYDRHHHAANARVTREAKSPQLRLGLVTEAEEKRFQADMAKKAGASRPTSLHDGSGR